MLEPVGLILATLPSYSAIVVSERWLIRWEFIARGWAKAEIRSFYLVLSRLYAVKMFMRWKELATKLLSGAVTVCCYYLVQLQQRSYSANPILRLRQPA